MNMGRTNHRPSYASVLLTITCQDSVANCIFKTIRIVSKFLIEKIIFGDFLQFYLVNNK